MKNEVIVADEIILRLVVVKSPIREIPGYASPVKSYTLFNPVNDAS